MDLELDSKNGGCAPLGGLDVARGELGLIGDVDNRRAEGLAGEGVRAHGGRLAERKLAITVFGNVDGDRQAVQAAQRECGRASRDDLAGLDGAGQDDAIRGRNDDQLGNLGVNQSQTGLGLLHSLVSLVCSGLRLMQGSLSSRHLGRIFAGLQGQQAVLGRLVALLGCGQVSAGGDDLLGRIAIFQIVVGGLGILQLGLGIVVSGLGRIAQVSVR